MEAKQYLDLLKRWAWLLILGAVLGTAAGYIYSRFQSPVYQSSTQFMVTRAPQSNNAQFAVLYDQQWAQTYIQLLTTRPVLQATSDVLGYPVSANNVSASLLSNTQVIRVTVEDGQPQHAADIANTLVKVLIDQNDNLQAGRFTSTEASLQAQITQVQNQITNLQNQIDQISTQSFQDQLKQVQDQITILQPQVLKLQADIKDLTRFGDPVDPNKQTQLQYDQAQLDNIQPLLKMYQDIYANLVVLGQTPNNTDASSSDKRLAGLQTSLNLYQQTYTNLENNLESLRLARLQNTPNVVQIEEAVVISNPIRPKPLSTTTMTGTLGLFVAAILAFLIEYLDDTLKTSNDVEAHLGTTVIGYIADMNLKKGDSGIFVVKNPRSSVSEAFRSLRTNLDFAGVSRSLKTILVTSSGPGEGKSTTAANLAAILAQSGKKVILMDADMRRPNAHRLFGLRNRIGLTDIFREQISLQKALHPWDQAPGISLLTSGSLPPNPAELLASPKMDAIISELKTLADYIIIDSPPTIITDAQVLASKVDGVIMVIRPGKTQRDVAVAAVEQFTQVGGKILGVVLNRIPRNRSHYYGGYRYYSPYYYASGKHHYYARMDDHPSEEEASAASALLEPIDRKPINTRLNRFGSAQPSPKSKQQGDD